jgi:hypothetical protein
VNQSGLVGHKQMLKSSPGRHVAQPVLSPKGSLPGGQKSHTSSSDARTFPSGQGTQLVTLSNWPGKGSKPAATTRTQQGRGLSVHGQCGQAVL